MRPSSPHSKARPSTPKAAVPGRPSVPATPHVPVGPPQPAAGGGGFVPANPAAGHGAEVAAEADAIARVVEDDDTLNLPAPPPETLGVRRAPPKRPQRQLASRTVEFKQTLIPILLMMGLLMTGLGVWVTAMGEESPLLTATWIPKALVGIGAVLLLFAVVTMLQVRSQLMKQGAGV
jgi:hypothetical protein